MVVFVGSEARLTLELPQPLNIYLVKAAHLYLLIFFITQLAFQRLYMKENDLILNPTV